MKPIKLSYYQKQPLPNFGDDLSPYLVEQITKLPIRHSEHASAELFAVGSILGFWTGHKRAYKKQRWTYCPKKDLWQSGAQA